MSIWNRRPRNKHAKAWADYMAATRDYRHDKEHTDNLHEGENLNAFVFYQGAPPSTAKLQEGRVIEKNNHQGVATGCVEMAGHYLQMTSRAANEVGCATGFTSGLDVDTRGAYLECRYSPAGGDSWVMNQTKSN